jgi:2-methylisocitrate lyase-like PEP mutase family enzyme
MPQNDDDWRLASQRIDAPLVTLGMLGGRSKEAWQSLGFSLVIDPFSAQVLAVNAIREAFQRFHETGDIGWSARDLFAIYNELDRIAGFDALYAIEEATTERPPE